MVSERIDDSETVLFRDAQAKRLCFCELGTHRDELCLPDTF